MFLNHLLSPVGQDTIYDTTNIVSKWMDCYVYTSILLNMTQFIDFLNILFQISQNSQEVCRCNINMLSILATFLMNKIYNHLCLEDIVVYLRNRTFFLLTLHCMKSHDKLLAGGVLNILCNNSVCRFFHSYIHWLYLQHSLYIFRNLKQKIVELIGRK